MFVTDRLTSLRVCCPVRTGEIVLKFGIFVLQEGLQRVRAIGAEIDEDVARLVAATATARQATYAVIKEVRSVESDQEKQRRSRSGEYDDKVSGDGHGYRALVLLRDRGWGL